MTDNEKIRDSSVAGQAFLPNETTVTIDTIGAYEPIEGIWELSNQTARFTVGANNTLEYLGNYPALINFSATFTVDPANNDRIGFQATLNDVELPQSRIVVEQGAGPGSSPRIGTIVSLFRVVKGDRIGVSIANLDSTSNIELLTGTFQALG